MKIKLVVLNALIAFGVSSVQASDTQTPDILSSVSSDSIQAMTNSESADTRGEYIYCRAQWSGPVKCNAYYLRNPINTAPFNNQFANLRYAGRWNGYYVSR